MRLFSSLSGCLILFSLLLFSCSRDKKEEAKTIASVEGDWILIEDWDETPTYYFGIRFKDDTLYRITNETVRMEGKYEVKDKEITVHTPKNKKENYRLVSNTGDTLILAYGHDIQKYYSRRLEYSENLKFNQIGIEAGSCFGECPQFLMIIENTGNVTFKGITNCKLNDTKIFHLPAEKMKKIDSLFKWTNIHHFDPEQAGSMIDDWKLRLILNYNDNKTVDINTSYFAIPYRYRQLTHLLINTLREEGLIH
jgi:hypothetical protein